MDSVSVVSAVAALVGSVVGAALAAAVGTVSTAVAASSAVEDAIYVGPSAERFAFLDEQSDGLAVPVTHSH